MADRLAVQLEDAGFVIATGSCLLFVVWGRTPTAADIERISVPQRELVATYGHCVSLTVVPSEIATQVNEGVREASAENLREFGRTNLGAAILVQGGGVRATLVRSLITGIQLLAFSPMKQKVFASSSDALAWLSQRPGLGSAHARGLVEYDAQVRALL